MSLSAEIAYLFRHAMLREAAYQLQPPAERSALHALALNVIEEFVPAAHLPPLAHELVQHARGAMAGSREAGPLRHKEARYLGLHLEHARKGYDHAGSLAALELLRRHPDVEATARLRHQREYGLLLHSLGRNAEADAELQVAIHEAGTSGDIRERVLAQLAQAQVFRVIQRVPEAEALLLEALSCAREAGEPQLAASVSRQRAMLQLRTGRSHEAEVALTGAVAVHRTGGEPRELASDLANLGLLYHQTGRLAEAETVTRDALAILADARDERGVARVLGNLSNILADRADAAGAQALLEQASECFRRCGDLYGQALLASNLGSLHREAGRTREAEASYRTAAELCRDLGETRHQAYCEAGVAAILAQREQYAEAETLLIRSIETMRRFNDLHNVGSLLCELAILHLRLKREEAAEATLWEALAIVRATAYTRMEASALAELGVLYFSRGRLAAGMALTDEAVRISEPTAQHVNTAMWRSRRAMSRLLLGDLDGATADADFAGRTLGAAYGFYRLFHWFPAASRLAAFDAELHVPTTQLAALDALMDSEPAGGPTSHHDPDTQRQIEKILPLRAELARAVIESRPALLFHGYEPASLPAVQRLALLEHLRLNQPARLARLREHNPALLDAMQSGTSGLELPAWQEPHLPAFTPRAGT